MNILLNNYCNLKCPYCFQWKVLEHKRQDMSLENFHWLLDFIKKSNQHEVRLIGGEPTLHPKFIEILQEQLFDDNIEHIHLFTNGTFGNNILKQLINASKIKRISLLININELLTYQNKQLDLNLNTNLKLLTLNNISVNQGINIYSKNQSFDYFYNLVDKYNLKNIRWTITTPTHLENTDMLSYFKERYSKQKEFLKMQIDRRLFPHPDCNNIPSCVWDLDMYNMFSASLPNNIKNDDCTPVLDVQPDMTVIRCFMFSEFPVNIKQFNSINEVREYFIENIDNKIKGIYTYDKCQNCYFQKINNRSCGCKQFYKSKIVIDKSKFIMKEDI